jgi:hypothetical protein
VYRSIDTSRQKSLAARLHSALAKVKSNAKGA